MRITPAGKLPRQNHIHIIYFLTVLFTSTIPILLYVVKGHGIYTLADDFDTQIIPFGIDMVRTIRAAGPDAFSFKIDLGSSSFLGYTYYGLFSPFFAPAYLFPESMFPYVTGVLFIIKYMVACYTSYYYIRRFTDREIAAMTGSLMYAFSGYSCANMLFFFFHDIIALFPLLLFSLETMIGPERDHAGDGLFFSAMVFLNCITNYFFFVQEVIFLIIYYLFRCADKGVVLLFKHAGRILAFGALGVGMAAVVFLPNIIYIMQSNRVLSESESVARGIVHDLPHMMMVLKGILLPAEAMNAHSAVMERDFLIGSLYLPGGGVALTIAYILKNRTWLSRLLSALFFLSFSPLLSSVFLLFVSDYYRWWFMPALLMALAAAMVLDRMERYSIRYPAWFCMAAVTVFSVILLLMKDGDGNALILRPYRYTILLLIAVSAWAVLLSGRIRWIYLSVAAGCVMTTFFVQHWYRKEEVYTDLAIVDHYRIATSLQNDDSRFRYQNSSNFLLFPSGEGISGLRSYTTTASHALRELDGLFGFYQSHGDRRMNKTGIPGLPEALGGKYLVISEIGETELRPVQAVEAGHEIRNYDINGRNVRILEYPASPIAYTTDRFIRQSVFEQLENEQKGIALLYAVLLEDPIADTMPPSMQEISATDVRELILSDPEHTTGEGLFLNRMIAQLSEENTGNSLLSFDRNYHGLYGKTKSEEERLVSVSVPGDPGWSTWIDGEETELLNSGGLMALRVPAGEHEVRFRYRTPYLTAGMIISLISVAIWSVLLYYGISARKPSTHSG